MSPDIFDFWADVPGDARRHPADVDFFNDAAKRGLHGAGFDLNCLPIPFYGPLRTARVVLLYTSPGVTEVVDHPEANNPESQERHFRQRQGDALLESATELPTRFKWWSERAKFISRPISEIRVNLSVLNLAAYHSTGAARDEVYRKLPSIRVTYQWAHRVLFPQARKGKRVVICLRAKNLWNLSTPSDGTLFVPEFTRSGHMFHGPAREVVTAATQAASDRGPLVAADDA